MRLLARLSVFVLILTLAAPSGSARIYPHDFLLPVPLPLQRIPSSSSTMPERTNVSSEPFFVASEIPAGKLTRAQFIDAIATRLYDVDAHDYCFRNLVLSETVDFDLLLNDVSPNMSYATSVCVTMLGGLIRGYSDGTFRPNNPITVAEAAAIFGHIGGLPLRDSNHMKSKEAWYQRYMDAMRSIDREFTMQPGDVMTGAQLRHALCVLEQHTPELDPMGEFNGC